MGLTIVSVCDNSLKVTMGNLSYCGYVHKSGKVTTRLCLHISVDARRVISGLVDYD
jgi:hypothetical protein